MSALTGQKHSFGFTLVEMLVALTIMAIVAGLLMNSLRFSISTADTIESRISSIELLHQSYRAIRRQLQLAQPVYRDDDKALQELDFSADARQLDFVGPLPGLAAGGGLYRISLRIEDSRRQRDQGGQLIMRYRMYLDGSPGTGDDGDSREVVVLDNFASASFSYLDTLRPNGGSWTPDWRYTDRLPDLVQLSIDFGDGAANETMNMIVAIKATVPAHVGAI